MSKTTKTEIMNQEVTEVTSANPFDFSSQPTTVTTENRKLDFTPSLIATSTQRAQEIMLKVSKNPELFNVANKAVDGGQAQDLIDLIEATIAADDITSDATLLEGCDEGQLARLLESRRSDRSKTKAKGPKTNVLVCRTYIATMYAELLVRRAMNKPYNAQSINDIDYGGMNQDEITRKIKSLQSKQSRLNKLACFDADAAIELQEVKTAIASLNALRPANRTNSKVVVKDLKLDELRKVLGTIDVESLPADEQAKMLALIAKLG